MENNLVNGYVNLQRFWSNVKKTDSCWLWTSRAVTGGAVKYGLVSMRVLSPRGNATRWETAHRVSYELVNGPIPSGLHILHSCDTGLCVNPAHLRLGTRQDNTDDMVLRDRCARGGRTPGIFLPPAPLPTGSGKHHWFAKLTDAQVVEMRTLYADETRLTVAALARRFSVSKPCIIGILTGKSRRGVGGPISTIRKIYGTTVPSAKLTPKQVVELRLRAEAGATTHELGVRFGISPGTASKIIRGETWKSVGPARIPTPPGHCKLTREQAMRIRQRHAKGVSQARLARDYGVGASTISMLVRGRTHPTSLPRD